MRLGVPVALSAASVVLGLVFALLAYRQGNMAEGFLRMAEPVLGDPRGREMAMSMAGEFFFKRNLFAALAMLCLLVAIGVLCRQKLLPLIAAHFSRERLTVGKLSNTFPTRNSRIAAAAACAAVVGALVSWAALRSSDEERLHESVRELVRSGAFDPEAMRFRNMASRTTPTGFHVVCGEVNGKNRMGGYTGYQPFVLRDDRIEMLSNEKYEYLCFGRQ
jgi:hypothetical protein